MTPEFQALISTFSSVFSKPVWKKAQLLLVAALLCPGSRTITNLLRTAGHHKDKQFHKFHRFLSKDKWSALRLSQLLLSLLVKTFVPAGEALVFGIDETIERRWGRCISKRGIYRDAVRCSASHFVKCSGLRWMSVMLLTPLPWLKRGSWALPVITALCPSQRYWQERQQPRSHKTLMDWASQLMSWLARYTKDLGREVYLVGDGTYTTYELMGQAQKRGIGLIARMRMDARLFHFPTPPPKGKPGPKPKLGKRILSMTRRLTDKRINWQRVVFTEWYGQSQKEMLIASGESIWSRQKGQRVALRWVLIKDPEGRLDPVLIACSNQTLSAADMVRHFVRRWQVEVTFAELRRHLGVESQRQWSDKAIERCTPLLMGLFSLVCLMAVPLFKSGRLPLNKTAWYDKKHYSFSDIYTGVRRHLWSNIELSTSPKTSQVDNLKEKIRYLERVLLNAAA